MAERRSDPQNPTPEPIVDPESPRQRREREIGEAERARGKGAGHVHQLDRVNRMRIVLGALLGAPVGGMAGFFLGRQGGGSPGLLALLGAIAGVGLFYLVIAAIVGASGRAAATVYMPGGKGSAAPRGEYSLAESLAARGRFEDAISVFQEAVAEDPDDPTPYLRIARISRDELDRPDEAIRWFRTARSEARLGGAELALVSRELIELYRKGGEPAKAAPELARLAEMRAGTPEGAWADRELAEAKREMREAEREGGGAAGRGEA